MDASAQLPAAVVHMPEIAQTDMAASSAKMCESCAFHLKTCLAPTSVGRKLDG